MKSVRRRRARARGQHSGGAPGRPQGNPINKRAQSDQGALQYRPSRPVHSDIAQFDGAEGERARVQKITQFVRENPKPFIQRLNTIVRQNRIALIGKLRDSISDAIVEAAVERFFFYPTQFIPFRSFPIILRSNARSVMA